MNRHQIGDTVYVKMEALSEKQIDGLREKIGQPATVVGVFQANENSVMYEVERPGDRWPANYWPEQLQTPEEKANEKSVYTACD